jgi:cytidyltransferase-like protein
LGINVYTGGTFDLFHSGHTNFLGVYAEISDTFVVSLNNDLISSTAIKARLVR